MPVRLIFPNQLFVDHMKAEAGTTMVLIEDDLFFKQFPFHKQKLILHRASMRHFADELRQADYAVEIIETSDMPSMDQLTQLLAKLKPSAISYYDLVDDWLQRRLDKVIAKSGVQAQRYASPAFLTSLGQIDDYFAHNPNRMKNFYQWQRKRLNILLEAGQPVGGRWSYDTENRKKLPKNVQLPPAYPEHGSDYVEQAKQWVDNAFKDNPGNGQTFRYPVTHKQAEIWLQRFVTERLAIFGPYEDAIAKDLGDIFHSVLSPLLNCGLLTPQHVVDEVLAYNDKHEVPLESLEGFIRQVIGWREYMRATYVQFGSKMRTSNHYGFDRKLEPGWWDGTVGLAPIDTVIKRVLDTSYAHHIERLMVLGNSMVLLRIDPDEVYYWFMSLFIDAYDWVMVPNVYAMSQFAVGEMITTKPYISGSNYIIKMSDYTKDDWAVVWDALYWTFIDDQRASIEKNFRLKMVIGTYDRFTEDKKQQLSATAKPWLA